MLDNHKNIIFALTLSMVFIGCFIFLQNKPETSIENPTTLTINKKAAVKKIKPDYVRAIYLTANSAGSEKYRANIITAMKNSRINSVVIDVKDYSGYILYASQVAEVKKMLNDEKILTPEEIEKIDMPIGIKFAAETPQEIAVSILAKLIDVRNTLR